MPGTAPSRGRGLAALLLAALAAACGSTATPSSSTRPTTSAAAHDVVAAACRGDVSVTTTGNIANPALVETSGLVASRAHADVFWAHNDSGDSARVFALSGDGSDRGVWGTRDVTPRDWEDIAIGPGSTPGAGFLYLGDIGDNQRARPSIQIVRIPEPNPATRQGPNTTLSTERPEVLTLTYPDGPHDAETLLVDPDDGTIVIVTKEAVGPAGVYVARPEVGTFATTMELRRTGEVRLGLVAPVTGGDVSPDGRTVGLRTYREVFLMHRSEGTSVASALRSDRCSVRVDDETQGEALALLDDAFVTTSEGAGAPLHRGRVG